MGFVHHTKVKDASRITHHASSKAAGFSVFFLYLYYYA
jgi:hypothetical protein